MAVSALLAGLFVVVWCLASWGGGVTPAGYDRIVPGMTAAEVEAVLGCPPGGNTEYRMKGTGVGPPEYCTGKTWEADRIVIQVWFDDRDGRVRDKECRPGRGRDRPSTVWRLLRRLGL